MIQGVNGVDHISGINKVKTNVSSDQNYQLNEKQNYNTDNPKIPKEEKAVVLELGNDTQNSVTYGKPTTQKTDMETIDKLWKETEKATQSLRNLVESLINKQGKKLQDLLDGKETLVIDSETRAAAEKAISEDGEWGVKAVSTRIVEFAKAFAGDDKEMLGKMRSAIEEGFKEAEKAFGGQLPDISKKTYDEVMKQMDELQK